MTSRIANTRTMEDQAEEMGTSPGRLASTGPREHNRAIFFSRMWEEFEQPALLLFGHAVFMVFGLLILSLLGWIIDISHVSDITKHVAHIMDEYLMIFAFVVFGFSFIIKIVLIVLGGSKSEH